MGGFGAMPGEAGGEGSVFERDLVADGEVATGRSSTE